MFQWYRGVARRISHRIARLAERLDEFDLRSRLSTTAVGSLRSIIRTCFHVSLIISSLLSAEVMKGVWVPDVEVLRTRP